MKISIIGAGNVGGLTVMRLAELGIENIVLLDVAGGLAQGKALDMEDSRAILKGNYHIQGTDNIAEIKDSEVIVITAGLTRKPGMTREDLLQKNAQILKGLCSDIKKLSPESIIIVVTNPLDLMAGFVLKATGFHPNKVFGMGISLDASRFANLIARELNVPPADIDACVIGSHGEKMLPLPRFTTIKGVALDEFLDEKRTGILLKKTVERGQEIVSLLGSGSASFAPSAAIADIIRAIIKDEKRTIGVSAQLKGEYGVKDVSIGVPCRLGKKGIEGIIELDLNQQEKKFFLESAAYLKEQFKNLSI
ncbi:MAG: malate dehydrogenase [Candidatus Omnitrophota bacterium]|jgi:malate dehydrogenase